MADTDVVEIDCGDALGIADVASLYTKLLDTVAEGHQIKLNINGLERIDAAAVQMLYALNKELSEHGVKVLWTDPSEAFKTAVKLLGLADRMNIDENSG
jgi:anti-anti-sigma regulatory factor